MADYTKGMFFIPFGTREHEPRRSFPFITVMLVVLNLAAFIFEGYILYTLGPEGLNNLLNQLAVVPAEVTDTTPLEVGLLTSMFLHAGLLHFLGNMLYLLPFGDNVEDRLGHLRYLLFYLLCGLIATFVYIAFNRNSAVPLIGASGAIAGVLGGYLALHPRGTVKGFFFIIIVFFRIDLPAFIFIGYWFIMQLFSSVASFGAGEAESGGVAFLAHVGGFIAGVVLAPLLAATAPSRTHVAESAV